MCWEQIAFAGIQKAQHSLCVRQEKAVDEEPTTLIRAGCYDHGGHNDVDYQLEFWAPPE